MKTIYFYLMLVCFITSFTMLKGNEPIVENFGIANYEVKNINTGRFLFKKSNCTDNGYSFFSPFNINPELLSASYKTTSNDKGEVIITTNIGGNSTEYKMANFNVDKSGSFVSFDILVGKYIFKSTIQGRNLTSKFLLNYFDNSSTSVYFSQACPPCAVFVVAVVASAAVKICTDASSACSPCNGTLIVSACSCSCQPKK